MPKGSGGGWIKTYPPGSYRGRDGWHVRGRDLYGRPIEGRLPAAIATAAAAERLGQQLLKQANSRPPAFVATPPEPTGAKGPDRSFEAAARAYRVVRRPRAVEWERIERLIACPEIGPVHVDELTTQQVSTFATAAMPKNKPDTLNREIVTPYSAVLHFAAELKWCGRVVIRRFPETEDDVRAVTPREVDALVANADATATYGKGARARRDHQAPYKVALLEYLRLRGTRISDVLRLERARDLDLPGMRVRLTIGKARDKVQWMPLTPKVAALLANLAPCDGVWVFPWRTKSGVYKWLTPLNRRLGLNVTPHQFRHAMGEEAMDAEIDVLTQMGMGAWSSLNSARRYARVSRKRMESADHQRHLEARAAAGREMVAEDLGEPIADNVVTLKRTA